MKTKVVHCKKEPFDIYIGRPTIYGNLWTHRPGTKAKFRVRTLQEALACYKDWLLGRRFQDVEPGKRLLAFIGLPQLRGKVLGCWCKPGPCHGDILAELAGSVMEGSMIKLRYLELDPDEISEHFKLDPDERIEQVWCWLEELGIFQQGEEIPLVAWLRAMTEENGMGYQPIAPDLSGIEQIIKNGLLDAINRHQAATKFLFVLA